MRAVIQRVREASVCANNETVAKIGLGILVLLCVEQGDTDEDARYLSEKIVNLRIFSDENDTPNLSVLDVHGELLSVSQFTLAGDARKGRRPSYSNAAPPTVAKPLFELFCRLCSEKIPLKTGVFQADMKVSLINDGPFTILLSSRKEF